MIHLTDRAVEYFQHSILSSRAHRPAGAVLVAVLYAMHHLNNANQQLKYNSNV